MSDLEGLEGYSTMLLHEGEIREIREIPVMTVREKVNVTSMQIQMYQVVQE